MDKKTDTTVIKNLDGYVVELKDVNPGDTIVIFDNENQQGKKVILAAKQELTQEQIDQKKQEMKAKLDAKRAAQKSSKPAK